MFPGQNGRAELSTRPLRKLISRFQREEVGASAAMSSGRSRNGGTRIGIAEAVEKILAESPLFHGQLKILIGGRDHAHVDGDFPISPRR